MTSWLHYLIITLIFFLLSCASQKKIAPSDDNSEGITTHAFPYDAEDTAPILTSDELQAKALRANQANYKYFLKIALGSEYGLGDFTVKKWSSDVKIEVVGHPTAGDLASLKRVIDELNALLATRINLEVVSSDGNLQMYFVPHEEFHQYEPPGIVFYGGFFWNWWNYSGEIYKSRIVIATDRITQNHRSHLIREELTQALGLMNDAMDYEDSIFYQGYSEITEFSRLDQAVIKMLYNEHIVAGMSNFEVEEVLSEASTSY